MVETIRSNAYARLEQDPARRWKLEFSTLFDKGEKQILFQLDDMAPRITWTFDVPLVTARGE